MMRYGGFKATESNDLKKIEVKDDYKYEFMGEYKYLPEKFVNEMWNHAEEYQKMYEDKREVL